MPAALPPTDLLTDLLRDATVGVGTRPTFAWIVRASGDGAMQTAWQIVVGRECASVTAGGVWDSGRVAGEASSGLIYGGPDLPMGCILWWSVRVWVGGDAPGAWAEPAPFRCEAGSVARPEAPRLRREQAVQLQDLGGGAWLADFATAAFARPVLRLAGSGSIRVHAGERCVHGRLDRSPPGTIRCRSVTVDLPTSAAEIPVVMPSDTRNTTPPSAVLVPAGMPEVAPFRYVEIEGLAAEPAAGAVQRDVLAVPRDRSAAAFSCDDAAVEAVWELCAHTVDATTFLGIFVDGDRERIAYEGDAWINQLSHRALDRTPATSRATIDHLLRLPTWPTEWQLHMPLMAWEDWFWTGDLGALARWRDDLAVRTLNELDRGDGLITTHGTVSPDLLQRLRLNRLADLVDWPPGSFTSGGTGERDGHEMPAVNTVVNAFHVAACQAMALIDAALGRLADAARWNAAAARTEAAMDAQLWDDAQGAFVDGVGSRHAAQHSTLFPLAFGLVRPDRIGRALDHVVSRGMACSVYAAQHLLDALYRHGRADDALALMTATHDRSWLRMLEVGSTMTLEAWDWRYKNNLDWNHAWATAPLNVCARWVLGVQAVAPGGALVGVHPQPGRLRRVAGRVPTMRGGVEVALRHEPGVRCELEATVPANVRGELSVPWSGGAPVRVWLDGVLKPEARAVAGRVQAGAVAPGRHHLLVELS